MPPDALTVDDWRLADVADVPFGRRTRAKLARTGYRTLGELADLADSELLRLPYVDQMAVTELRWVLRRAERGEPRESWAWPRSQEEQKASRRAAEALTMRRAGKTLVEIGEAFGISRARAGQLVARAERDEGDAPARP